MKNGWRILVILALMVAPAFGQRSATEKDFAALSSTTCTPYVEVNTARSYPLHYTIEFAVAGSPSTCELHLEGTIFRSIAEAESVGQQVSGTDAAPNVDCTSAGMFHVKDRPVRWARLCVSTLSGGTSPVITGKYLGVSSGN